MSSKEGQTVIEFRDVVRTYGEGGSLTVCGQPY